MNDCSEGPESAIGRLKKREETVMGAPKWAVEAAEHAASLGFYGQNFWDEAQCQQLAAIITKHSPCDYERLLPEVAELRASLQSAECDRDEYRIAFEAQVEHTNFVRNEYQNRLATAQGEVEALHNLTAVIHRDGGHHSAAVGDVQSAKDAETKWYEAQQERDEASQFLRAIMEATVLAGLPGGDREQTLKNVRELATAQGEVERLTKQVSDLEELVESGTPDPIEPSPLEAENARLTNIVKKAETMRDWFMHTTPEWNKSVEKAIDEFNEVLHTGEPPSYKRANCTCDYRDGELHEACEYCKAIETRMAERLANGHTGEPHHE